MTVDLRTTRYLGLELRQSDRRLRVSAHAAPRHAAPRLEDGRRRRRAVFPSLFEEQIEQEELEMHGLVRVRRRSRSPSRSRTSRSSTRLQHRTRAKYLQVASRRRSKRVDIPIIGSLNGVSARADGIRYAKPHRGRRRRRARTQCLSRSPPNPELSVRRRWSSRHLELVSRRAGRRSRFRSR